MRDAHFSFGPRFLTNFINLKECSHSCFWCLWLQQLSNLELYFLLLSRNAASFCLVFIYDHKGLIKVYCLRVDYCDCRWQCSEETCRLFLSLQCANQVTIELLISFIYAGFYGWWCSDTRKSLIRLVLSHTIVWLISRAQFLLCESSLHKCTCYFCNRE